MMKFLMGSLLAILMIASSAFAASDLECDLSQKPQQASDNIAALLSRGYLAAGHSYSSSSGSEQMSLGHHLLLTHIQKDGADSYSLTADSHSHMNDQQTFQALLQVSAEASKTLSADDAAALQNCDHLLGQYIGVSPQPDHP